MTDTGPDAGTLAGAVVQRRVALGLTQSGLAEKAGVALRTVQNIEAGTRPQPLTLGAVSRALGMEFRELQQLADKVA